MRTKYFSVYLLAIAVTTIAVSCFPKDDVLYTGPSIVEFKNYTLGQLSANLTTKGVSTAAADAQTDSTRAVRVNLRVTDTVLVQLVGPQRSTDISIDFSVRSTSTAIEGTHFNFRPAGARTVTIPANSSVGYILLDMVPNSVTSGSVRVQMDLLGSSSILPSKNYHAFFVTIKP